MSEQLASLLNGDGPAAHRADRKSTPLHEGKVHEDPT
jgi:hypothetical protein